MKPRPSSGFSLLEILISIGIVGIIVLAAASVVEPLMRIKHQMDTTSGLHLVATYMRECVASDEGWANTVADTKNNKSLLCLANNVPCITGSGGDIQLHSSNNELCYLNYDTRKGALVMDPATKTALQQGFSKDGTICYGFNEKLNQGNDNCPYRFNVTWEARCPLNMASGTTTGVPEEKQCYNPIVIVTGQMLYNPAPTNKQMQMNMDAYQMRAVRGRADQTRYFSIYETKDKGVPGGTCSPTGVYRQFTKRKPVDPGRDPGKYIRQLPGDGTMLLEAGTYDCHISVPGYVLGNHRAMLMDVKLKQALLLGTSEYAPNLIGYTQTSSMIDGMFTLQQPTLVGVLQVCSSLPKDPTLLGQTMGVPAGFSPFEVYSVMSCAVIARTTTAN